MTVKEFINNLNPESVLSGNISFKIISNNVGKWGGKWIFWCEGNENTVSNFCDNEGIVECMDLEIDYNNPIETIVDAYKSGSIQFIIYAEPKED